MRNKEHLKLKGFKKLLNIREQINQGKGHTRKYTKDYVLQLLESSETIRQET